MNSSKSSEITFLSTRALEVTFPGGTQAVKKIDMQVRQGEFVTLVGPSGCGKSTLLRVFAGLLPHFTGELVVAKEFYRPAFVFQEATLLPWRTVEENVRLPQELQGQPSTHTADEVAKILQLVGLHQFAHFYPAELSGGMKMRVSLARALLTQPTLLLLDEPFAALDELTRQRLHQELLQLWLQAGWTVLAVTHSVVEAVFLSHRVLVMSPRPGQIKAVVDIPLPYPRTLDMQTSLVFSELVRSVQQHLQSDR